MSYSRDPSPGLRFQGRPSAAAYMAQALVPTVLRARGRFPPLVAVWEGHDSSGQELREFLAVTGLPDTGSLPVTYPQVAGFPLQMAVLTHPSLPVPIWGALQVRSRFRRLRAIEAGVRLRFTTAVAGERALEKGTELDLGTAAHVGEELVWEGVTTYFYRGRHLWVPPEPAAASVAPPPVTGEEVARWRTPVGTGWRFGRISGDFNGVHWSRAYARLQGFQGRFHHPHLVIGQALARLAEPGTPAQGLDLWVRGPVYEGAQVRLVRGAVPGGHVFGLFVEERRPAIVGCWLEGPAPSG